MASVWVVLVERGVEAGASTDLYWREARAREAAGAYLASRWPLARPIPDDVDEAMEVYNEIQGTGEHLLVAELAVQGHQYFDGETDTRARCGLCGEPVILAVPDDPISWVHAEDANDWGDHTAQVDHSSQQPMDDDIA